MRSIKNILILYHRNIGDEAALERALSLAHRVGGSVTVSEIMDLNDGRPLSWFLPPSHRLKRAWERVLAEREAHFKRLLSSTQRLNVPVRYKALAGGPPYERLTRSIIKENIDLVIVTGAHMDLAGSGAQRSLVAKLMRGCPCPVWVADPDANGGLRRVAAAISLTEDPDLDREEMGRILRLVAQLQCIEQCRVDIVHAWDFKGAKRDRAHCDISREALKDMETAEAERRHARIRALLAEARLNGAQVQVHVERGPEHSIIPRFAARHHIDLVVMGGGRNESCLKSLFTRNIAREIFTDVPCSVLSVGGGREFLPAREHQLA